MLMKVVFFVLMVSMSQVFGAKKDIDVKMCIGGDGPGPLADISNSHIQSTEKLNTSFKVKDFTVTNNVNRLYYRTEENSLMEYDLKLNSTKVLSNEATKLSKVIDEDGKYLLSEKYNWLFNVFAPQLGWDFMGNPNEEHSLTHLYWKTFPVIGDHLFSVSSNLDTHGGRQMLRIYHYSKQNKRWTFKECSNLSNSAGRRFYIGEGHFYPYVFLYDTRQVGRETKLKLWNLKINGLTSCALIPAYSYVHSIPGKVLSVSQFEGSNLFAVRTTDPVKNMIWTNKENNKGCRYLNFGGRTPFILNRKQQAIATWAQGEGLNLIYPEKLTRTHFSTESTSHSIKKENLWLSDDGNSLFAAVQEKSDEWRDIYKYVLKK